MVWGRDSIFTFSLWIEIFPGSFTIFILFTIFNYTILITSFNYIYLHSCIILISGYKSPHTLVFIYKTVWLLALWTSKSISELTLWEFWIELHWICRLIYGELPSLNIESGHSLTKYLSPFIQVCFYIYQYKYWQIYLSIHKTLL